jgi:hypothetical protein
MAGTAARLELEWVLTIAGIRKSTKSSSNCARTGPFSLSQKPMRDCATWKV